MKRPLYLAATLLMVALVAPTAHAGGTRAAQKKRAVEADAQSLEKQLTAPCCYKGTLTDHASGLATKMRADIRTMLAQGMSKKQILAHYKKKYGQAVLVEPPGGGLSGFLLYGVPFGVAFIGLLVMTVLMARKRAPSAGAEQRQPTSFQIPTELDERIDAMVHGGIPVRPPSREIPGMTLPMQTIFSLGGVAGSATEALPSPTLFVVVYGILWLGLVGWIAWLATQQHGLDRGVSEVQAQLQTRLDQAERRSPHTD